METIQIAQQNMEMGRGTPCTAHFQHLLRDTCSCLGVVVCNDIIPIIFCSYHINAEKKFLSACMSLTFSIRLSTFDLLCSEFHENQSDISFL